MTKFGISGYGFGQGAGTLLSVGGEYCQSITEIKHFRTVTPGDLRGLLPRVLSFFPEEDIPGYD